jgi:hypothetical protein
MTIQCTGMTLVYTIMNLQFPQKTEKFLIQLVDYQLLNEAFAPQIDMLIS